MGHAGDALGSHLAEQVINLGLGHALIAARVDAHNHTGGTLKLGLHGIAVSVTVKDGLSGPALLNQAIADGDGVPAVAIGALVRASAALNHQDGAFWLEWLGFESYWYGTLYCSRSWFWCLWVLPGAW